MQSTVILIPSEAENSSYLCWQFHQGSFSLSCFGKINDSFPFHLQESVPDLMLYILVTNQLMFFDQFYTTLSLFFLWFVEITCVLWK